MNKLIYVDEVKKRFPIMENDFGMIVNETLHKELDKIPSVKAISLEKIKYAREEIKRQSYSLRCIDEDAYDEDEIVVDLNDVLAVLDEIEE